MSDNPNLPSVVPNPPDFEKLRNAMTIIDQNGYEVALNGDDLDIQDLTPVSGLNTLPIIRAGQADETKGSYTETDGKKKTAVYPFEKQLFLETPEYGESEESGKPELHSVFSKLPLTDQGSIYFIPLAFDQNRRYWQGEYNPDDISEPTCQSNRYAKLPIPDERYLTRADDGKLLSGVVSHACMALDPQTHKQLVPFCPMAQWQGSDRPGCVEYVLIYGLVFMPDKLDPTLVLTLYKRSSIKSGLAVKAELKAQVRAGLPIYHRPYKLIHYKPNDNKAGYTLGIVALKTDGKHLSTDETFPGFTERFDTVINEGIDTANRIIEASRASGAVKPLQLPSDDQVLSEDAPF